MNYSKSKINIGNLSKHGRTTTLHKSKGFKIVLKYTNMLTLVMLDPHVEEPIPGTRDNIVIVWVYPQIRRIS